MNAADLLGADHGLGASVQSVSQIDATTFLARVSVGSTTYSSGRMQRKFEDDAKRPPPRIDWNWPE
jgi:predicted alpha/beta-hydrolase family hydrolase